MLAVGAHDAFSQIFKMANENLAQGQNFDILVTFVGLKTIREIPMQKMAWKKMTRFRRAARTLHWEVPLWNQAQKFFMHMKIKIDPIFGQNICSHLAIFAIEVRMVFAVFDPLCPDALQQGPWPMVIRSTFGGLPNDPPNSLVRVPGLVLGPVERSHSKTGQISISWFIHPGVIFLGKGVMTYFCICNESNLGQLSHHVGKTLGDDLDLCCNFWLLKKTPPKPRKRILVDRVNKIFRNQAEKLQNWCNRNMIDSQPFLN